MSDGNACAAARSQFWLLLYGELSFDEEERVETHLDGCAECRAALERERELHANFDASAIEPPASLLHDCRAELFARLEAEPLSPEARRRSVRTRSWWQPFRASFPAGAALVLKPAGALALIAIGFFGSRFAPPGFAGLNEAGMAQVRDIQNAPDGRVQIVVDVTHQRVVSGALDDGQIRTLLIEAARDPHDPGLREHSLALLNGSSPSPDVRDVLVYALRHDQNAGVRLKAMEGLKSFATQPEVRSTLSQTLLTDPNPGVRTQAIDLLVQGEGDNLDRQMVGTLQELMLRENNAYLRQRCQAILEALNASTEMY